jgi:hypothetical protein
VRACVYRGECSYVYEYLRLYCVSKKIHIVLNFDVLKTKQTSIE